MAEGGELSDQRNSQAELTQETVSGNYFGFKTKSCQSDIKLEVGGDTLYINKVVLGMASPVLKKIFDEKLHDEDKNDVTLEDEDAEEFCEFLACFYPSCEHEVDMSNVFRILPLACKYKVDRLMKKSVALLMKSLAGNPGEFHIYKCLSVAKQHSITTMEEKCMELLVDVYKLNIDRADEILTLKADVKPVVMSAMIPFLRSEASKYKFLSGGPHGSDRYMDLDDFQDAKYSTVQVSRSHADLVSTNRPVFGGLHVLTLTLWNVDLDIKISSLYKPEFTCKATCTMNSRCKVAVKLIFKNNIPGEPNIWIGNKGETPLYLEYTGKLSLNTPGFRWNDMYTIVVHVLMERPHPRIPRGLPICYATSTPGTNDK